VTSGAFGWAFNGSELPNTSTEKAAMVFSQCRTSIDRIAGGNVCAVRASLGVIRLTSGACIDLRQSSCTPRGLPCPGECPQQRQDCRDANRRSEAGAESLGRPEAPAGGEYGDGDRDPGHPTEKAQHVEGAGCFPDLSLRNRA